ncbi:unnamed protein product [Oppiella nova]|uniref:Cytochrome P450 n=1 Tax=Oppiella nova TaxID=334625 RepID=A0A7R9MRB7_9ACAR|nr:unnamed protein product [Oppiella nova]CAG2182229.1 unnamed protein product [Oppiella nova]
MLPLVAECRNRLIDNLDKLSKTGKPIDMVSLMGTYTMEVICNVAFGVNVDALSADTNPLIITARKILAPKGFNVRIWLAIFFPKIKRGDFLQQMLDLTGDKDKPLDTSPDYKSEKYREIQAPEGPLQWMS